MYSKPTHWAELERKHKDVAEKREETVAVFQVVADLAVLTEPDDDMTLEEHVSKSIKLGAEENGSSQGSPNKIWIIRRRNRL